MAHRLTTCTFCGVGCGLYLETAHNQVVGVYPSMSHPANRGRICVRGWNVHEVASSPDRLRQPLLKEGGRLREATWDEAFTFVVRRLKELRARYGPDALAFLNSPRCSNEESYVLQKFARTIIGTNNVDHGAGVYCNNSIHVLLQTLGVPATTNSIGELAKAGLILVDGVDLARQLPTIGGAVLRAKVAGAKLMVIDPRRHRLAENADLFLQLKPGTELFLYGAMAKVIVDRGLMNLAFIRAHCREYEHFLEGLREYDLLEAAEICGVPAESIEAAAIAYARAPSAAILYSTGIESREASVVRAIVNLVLLTGHIGKEGSGLYALNEQNNLQGVCDMGMLPDQLPGYRPVADSQARRELETLWNANLPAAPGLPSRSVLTDGGAGKIRALWLCRYDPVSTASFGDAGRVLQQCELVIVQHLFLTETAKLADVVLPTTAFGEERVTFTSTERRIQLADQVIEPLPNCSPAWRQITDVARAMGADWEYRTPGDVMGEIGRVIPFYSGADYENLAREYGRQWPCTKDRPLGTRFLFEEMAPRQFSFAPVPCPERVSSGAKEFPLSLVFGHSPYYWNNNVLIQHSETLKREYRILLLDYPEGFVELSPDDAKQFSIRDGERIRVRSATGAAVTTARVTPEVRSGAVFVPYFVRQVQQKILPSASDGLLVPVRLEKEAA